jgi:hypothetical protein
VLLFPETDDDIRNACSRAVPADATRRAIADPNESPAYGFAADRAALGPGRVCMGEPAAAE